MKKRQASHVNCDERWWFKGKAELVDMEIVVTPPTEVGEECRLEVWSPEGSFAVYAGKPLSQSLRSFSELRLYSQ
jgi:hypothetical protein